MGCGSSKPTQLTVPPTTPGPRMLKEDTPTGQVLTSPTPQATDRDSRIPENIQVTRSRVVVAVEAERVIQIETDNTPAESPCLTRTGQQIDNLFAMVYSSNRYRRCIITWRRHHGNRRTAHHNRDSLHDH